jgi:hypothetical protein
MEGWLADITEEYPAWAQAMKVKKLPEYRRVKTAVEAYEKTPSFKNTAILYDAVHAWGFSFPLYSAETSRTLDYLRKPLLQGKPYKKIISLWRKVDPEKVCISQEDAEWMSALSERVEKKAREDAEWIAATKEESAKMPVPEYSGGARIIKRKDGFIIKPTYCHVQKKGSEAAQYMEPIFKTKSSMYWHTHPAEAGARPAPSRGDVQATHEIKIPLLTISRMGKMPVIFLTLPDGKTVQVKILEAGGKKRFMPAV